MTIRELIEGLKEGKTVRNTCKWGKTAFYVIDRGELLDEEGDVVSSPADDIALYEFFNDITIIDAFFEEDKKETKENILTEDDIKLRDEVAKDIFYIRMSRTDSSSLEERAEYAFKAAEAFMKARNNA